MSSNNRKELLIHVFGGVFALFVVLMFAIAIDISLRSKSHKQYHPDYGWYLYLSKEEKDGKISLITPFYETHEKCINSAAIAMKSEIGFLTAQCFSKKEVMNDYKEVE